MGRLLVILLIAAALCVFVYLVVGWLPALRPANLLQGSRATVRINIGHSH